MTATVNLTWVRVHACERKRRYRSRRRAVTVAARTSTTDRPVRAYRCPFCRGHHTGHVPSMETLEQIAAAIRAAGAGHG